MSKRALTALEVLRSGGRFTERLERNPFRGGEQWQVRLFDASGAIVQGVGRAAKREIESLLVLYTSYSTEKNYVLRTAQVSA